MAQTAAERAIGVTAVTEPPYQPADVESKVCHNCKQRQPIAMYRPDTRREDGWSLWCADCRTAQRERLEATRSRGSINGGRLRRPKPSEAVLDVASAKNLAEIIPQLTEGERVKVLDFTLKLLLERKGV